MGAGLRLPALRQEGHLSEPYVLQRVLAYQHDTIQHDDNPMPMSSVQVELRVPRSLLLSMAAFEKQLLTRPDRAEKLDNILKCLGYQDLLHFLVEHFFVDGVLLVPLEILIFLSGC